MPRRGEVGRLLAVARPPVPLLAGGLAFLLAGTALGLAVPWVLANLLDDAVTGGVGTERLDRLALLVVGLIAVRALVGIAQGELMARAGEHVVLGLRRRLYDHLVGLELSFHDQQRIGELMSRVMSDVTQIQSVVTSQLALLLANGLTLAGALAILFVRSWRLTGLILVLVPFVVLLGRQYGRLMRRRSMELQDRFADTTSVAEESLAAIRLVQSFAREPHERARFAVAAGALHDAALGRARVVARFGPVISATTMSAVVVVLWFGGRQVVSGDLTVGDLLAFVVYSGMIAQASSGTMAVYGSWSGALGASRRVFELLDRRPAVVDRAGARPIGAVRGRVTFEGVRFAYGPGGAVLDGIDLDVAPSETLALVGPSGAGKSTLVSLIPRFYDPVAGRLLVDGVDVRDVTLASLRGAIGMVPQETLLFNASVAENIRYGRLDATPEEVREAARAAHAHAFVTELPDGYETVVGERGVRLSQGQRQRLAIARAVLKGPRLLLLDEATSSLDSESERLVEEALEWLMADRTTIIIAHRLSTVRRADRIAVLDRGRIVELGDHETLLERGGLYARLHALQFRDPAPEPAGTLARGSGSFLRG